jgi:hypothetical protein
MTNLFKILGDTIKESNYQHELMIDKARNTILTDEIDEAEELIKQLKTEAEHAFGANKDVFNTSAEMLQEELDNFHYSEEDFSNLKKAINASKRIINEIGRIYND